MGKVILSGYILVPINDIESIKSALGEHTALTRQEEHCLVFWVKQDGINPRKFSVYEEFSCKAGFKAHQKRLANSNWANASKNAERHYEIYGV